MIMENLQSKNFLKEKNEKSKEHFLKSKNSLHPLNYSMKANHRGKHKKWYHLWQSCNFTNLLKLFF